MKIGTLSKRKPITYIDIPYDTVKSIDLDSEMVVELYYKDDLADVNGIEYFRLSKDGVTYAEVKEYTVSNGVIRFKFPELLHGRYYPEIKDIEGHIYTALNNEYFDVVKSLGGMMQAQYYTVKELIVEDMQPEILEYMKNNPQLYKGEDGKDGKDGVDGKDGKDGKDGVNGRDGYDGRDGRDGYDGTNGHDGADGEDGASAYEIAVNQGFVGSETEWLESLKGEKGEDGNAIVPTFELDENGDLYYYT